MARDPLKPKHRSDFSHGLIHLTRKRSGARHFDPPELREIDETEISARNVLKEILTDGVLRGSTNSGYIKGKKSAVCFSEIPLASVRHFVESEEGRYSAYGIAITKRTAFRLGARPVIYLPDDEASWIPADEKWRHVRFEHGKVDFTHEREWRLQGDLDLSRLQFYILIWDLDEDWEHIKDVVDTHKGHLRGVLPLKDLLQIL